MSRYLPASSKTLQQQNPPKAARRKVTAAWYVGTAIFVAAAGLAGLSSIGML